MLIDYWVIQINSTRSESEMQSILHPVQQIFLRTFLDQKMQISFQLGRPPARYKILSLTTLPAKYIYVLVSQIYNKLMK